MHETNAPEVLWDYCLEWCAQIRSHTAMNIRELEGQVPTTKITGDTSDISHLAEFGFYDWVWFVDTTQSDGLEATGQPSMQNKRLGKYLGPARNVGSAMCGTVMTESSAIIHRTSIIPLSVADKNNEQVRHKKEAFQERLKAKLKDRIKGLQDGKKTSMDLEQEEFKKQMLEWQKEEVTPDFVPYEPWDPLE